MYISKEQIHLNEVMHNFSVLVINHHRSSNQEVQIFEIQLYEESQNVESQYVEIQLYKSYTQNLPQKISNNRFARCSTLRNGNFIWFDFAKINQCIDFLFCKFLEKICQSKCVRL